MHVILFQIDPFTYVPMYVMNHDMRVVNRLLDI